jgi:hypothetical protein
MAAWSGRRPGRHDAPVGPVGLQLGSMRSSQRKIFDPVAQIGRFRSESNQSQIADALTDRHVELMSVDHASEGAACPLTLCRLGNEVRISGEQDASERGGSIQELGVSETVGTVFLSGQNVDLAQPQPLDDGSGDVDVHEEADAQESKPRALSRVTSGESPASCRSRRAACSCRAISVSSAA